MIKSASNDSMPFFSRIRKVLVANRGEIACRIIRCCRENGLKSVAVYSTEDSSSMHVTQADEAVELPGIGATAYLNIAEIVKAAVSHSVDVVMPGYGFLAESGDFATALSIAGIIFSGPSPESIAAFGLKHSARMLAERSGVPIVPGTSLLSSVNAALTAANEIGYPVMIKATAGGGGIGMKVCRNNDELTVAFTEVVSRGSTLFHNDGAFIEKYIEAAHHIEIQIFGNGAGDVVSFGERECSIQRRHQKVVEEAPSPFVERISHLRDRLCRCAVFLASSVKYKSAGTVEFLVDDSTAEFYFLEMNTRIQVEHGITELVHGIDLVQMMLQQSDCEAAGEVGIPASVLKGSHRGEGHAIEARIYAENPSRDFQPSPGILHLVDFVKNVEPNCKLRIDNWVSTGTQVSPYFDPLLAKVMVWGPTRNHAVKNMSSALDMSHIYGPTINIDYLHAITTSNDFRAGHTLASFLETGLIYEPPYMEFIRPGTYTTVQDLPGRWQAGNGVPISGPADPLHFQLANIVVGNSRYTAALEITVKGPTIKFHTAAVVCLAGGAYHFKVNGQSAPLFTAINLPAGSLLNIGGSVGHGSRAYLAVKGGLPDIAEYLGSKACTPTLNLGGHQGRIIMRGDCLAVQRCSLGGDGFVLPPSSRPQIPESEEWVICTTGGPHDTLDICSEEKLSSFFSTKYRVNMNSNRTVLRLEGPADVFSRTTGGDGGSHPSNILEYPYPTCGLSVVGNDMALFGVDGATLSGFVCIAVPVLSEWWKAGQAKVGSKIQFKQVSYDDALFMNTTMENFLDELFHGRTTGAQLPSFPTLKIKTVTSSQGLLYHNGDLTIRQAGEGMILVDYGISEFSLVNCGRQKLLTDALISTSIIRVESDSGAVGIIFDPHVISQSKLTALVIDQDRKMPPARHLRIESTLYKLPCCFNHSALTHCIDRYMQTQRSQAPYLPNNVDYLMRANNIASLEEFKAQFVGQRQVVTAVSFVCADTLSVNLDPRTRFQSGKYNPARTFTPKGAIGSGSVSHSIYSIDSPGGYMIFAMGLPDLCWRTFSRTPWFFKNFDQIEYYEVDEDELMTLNSQLLAGTLNIHTEKVLLDFGDYIDFLSSIDQDVQRMNHIKTESMKQLADAEQNSITEWLEDLEAAKMKPTADISLNDPAAIQVLSPMSAKVFKINVRKGDIVDGLEILTVLEAMKMEIPLRAVSTDDSDEDDGDNSRGPERISDKRIKYEVLEIFVGEGDVVNVGDVILLIKTED